MELKIGEMLANLASTSGIGMLVEDPRYIIMIVISCVLLYLGIVKKFEPLLMVPIGFGMLLANLPLAGHECQSRLRISDGSCAQRQGRRAGDHGRRFGHVPIR